MWKRSFWLGLLALCSLWLSCMPCLAASVTISEPDWKALRHEFMELESRTTERERLIGELKRESSALASESVKLRQALAESREEVNALKETSETLKRSLDETDRALSTSEQSLTELKRQAEKDNRANERKLRLWQVLAATALAWAAYK